jgi:hypothetical protein
MKRMKSSKSRSPFQYTRRQFVSVLGSTYALSMAHPLGKYLLDSERATDANSRVDRVSLRLADVDHAVELAGRYLSHSCDLRGRFAYRVMIDSGIQADDYNIVRHAGAMYALAMLNEFRPNEEARSALIRAAIFLRSNYISSGPTQGSMAVWSDPQDKARVAELGSAGLALVSLSAAYKLHRLSIPISELQALGRFILFLQREDGSFASEYRKNTGAVTDFISLYYPGEAVLGLVTLYELDNCEQWIGAAERALAHLARMRARISTVPADHWSLIATAKLISKRRLRGDTVLRQELLAHASQVCTSMLRGQVQSANGGDVDGAFDLQGRVAPTATRLEGLLSACEFMKHGKLYDEMKAVIRRGISFLLRAQISSGRYRGAFAAALKASAPSSAEIRIDYVQHGLCALLRFINLIENGKPKG